jgi:hypothetical protein
MSCPHNFLPQGGKYPLCGIDGGICFGPDHHRWDECPVYFGPWGAWRSVLPEILEMLLATPFSGDPIADDILGIFFKAGAKIHLDAVGWSL